MSFDNEKKRFSREHIWYCEIVVGGQTYRFCEDVTPIPVGLEVEAASMGVPSIRPAQIDLTGGIGVRASLSLSFKSHLDYVRFGSLTNPVKFWPRWRAEHAGYEGASIAVFSGYIVNGVFNSNNFSRSDFIIESFSYNENGASITAKDTLKLASNDRSKAPRKSTGSLNANITNFETSVTLTPSGVGNSEYPASGFARIGDEVVGFTRTGDNFTLTRGEYNTIADSHNDGDDFQLCLQYNDTISDIIYDLLVEYSGVPPAQINKIAWDDEAGLYFPNLYEALITEPTGVKDLLGELGELGSYLFFDIRTNLINFVAIKAPPETATTLTAESNFLLGSTSVSDKPEMRVSTVIVNFGIFDPTKDLDEVSNYRQAHVRLNPAAVARYNGIERYKVVNSRWINNSNRAGAVRLAAKIGRRFEDIPRMFTFSLDAKDSDVNTGATVFVNSDLIVNDTGAGERFAMPVQIISANEQRSYNYTALEYGYGQELPEDLESEQPNQRLVILSGELTNINLRTIYDSLFPDAQNTYEIVFVFDSSCLVGSTDIANTSLDTGLWPELTTSRIRLDVRGLIVGAGGAGTVSDGGNGGDAITLNTDIELTNTGIIGGGGGGGGGYVDFDPDTDTSEIGGGGGGAGYLVGQGANGSDNGTTTQGGDGQNGDGGDGGDLGQNGTGVFSSSGGIAGDAIITNGNSITYLQTGDIRGAVI